MAATILTRTGPVTSMKLQKLIYYSQAWHLVRTNEPLFEDRIEAWPQGPVVPSVFRKHSKKYTVTSWPSGDAKLLTEPERETVSWVLDKYSHLSAESLSRLTHIEPPWRIARGLSGPNEKSSEEIIKERLKYFYGRQIADVDSAVAHAAASAAMEGVEFADDWQDVLRSVASSEVSAAEAIQREIDRVRRS
ncbi:SocA family protein [Kibdelosporangium philippinense]|uniref:SocA family protein n=1 Tax=Kibdelosporangium philippinense TaxID=211113 RepID=A0ABS8ZHT2_9PSEU|nr:SocA family protein [Kibdelosporangium philippinense]MCE7006176.1 SocA family protein [Kibdelosporangium philippinense]